MKWNWSLRATLALLAAQTVAQETDASLSEQDMQPVEDPGLEPDSIVVEAARSGNVESAFWWPSEPGARCKCFPGDGCWPADRDWDALNGKVRGRLRRVVPPGAVCYASYNGVPTADADKCAEVSVQWFNATWT